MLKETKYFSVDFQNEDIVLYEISTGSAFFKRYADNTCQALPEFEIIKEYLNKICIKLSEFDRYNYDIVLKPKIVARMRKEKIAILLQ